MVAVPQYSALLLLDGTCNYLRELAGYFPFTYPTSSRKVYRKLIQIHMRAIRRMVRKHRVDVLCLQETKKEQIDKFMCQAIWGEADVCWEMQPSTNTAGGLLCLWNEKRLKVESKVIGFGSFYSQYMV